MQALDMIKGKNILVFMDSHLEGNFSTEAASTIVQLASQCLQYEPKDRPDMKSLVAKLESLQIRSEVRPYIAYVQVQQICVAAYISRT